VWGGALNANLCNLNAVEFMWVEYLFG